MQTLNNIHDCESRVVDILSGDISVCNEPELEPNGKVNLLETDAGDILSPFEQCSGVCCSRMCDARSDGCCDGCCSDPEYFERHLRNTRASIDSVLSRIIFVDVDAGLTPGMRGEIAACIRGPSERVYLQVNFGRIIYILQTVHTMPLHMVEMFLRNYHGQCLFLEGLDMCRGAPMAGECTSELYLDEASDW
jgi:hypothetical protein